MFSQFPDIMSVHDLSRALSIGLTKAYKLVNSGEIRSLKVSQGIRIPKAALLEYIFGTGFDYYEADKRPYHKGGIE